MGIFPNQQKIARARINLEKVVDGYFCLVWRSCTEVGWLLCFVIGGDDHWEGRSECDRAGISGNDQVGKE